MTEAETVAEGTVSESTHNFEVFERHPAKEDTPKRCDKPSYYRYQRGCRCDPCREAYTAKRLEFRQRAAEREGRVHGERPCLRCNIPISTLKGSARKEYCPECAVAVLREQQADYRRRRKMSKRPEPTPAAQHSPATITELPTERLTLGDDVRLDEDDEALEDLAASIGEFGLLQPLIVRPVEDGWEVVAGRRRLAAARIVGLEVVPCVVRELDDDRAFDVTLAENLHRRDLSWIEVALGYKRLKDRGLQQQQIAALVGKTDSQVSQVLRLLRLPQEIQDRVHCREISYGEAYRLAQHGEPVQRDSGHSDGLRGTSAATDDAAASHWRGRHERLIAGLYQMVKARDADEAELRRMLDRLLKLDRQPLPQDQAVGSAA